MGSPTLSGVGSVSGPICPLDAEQPQPLTPLEQLTTYAPTALEHVQQQQREQQAMQDALQKMMAERGPEIQQLKARIDEVSHYEPTWQNRRMMEGLQADLNKIFEAYTPQLSPTGGPSCRMAPEGPPRSPSTPSGMHIPLPMSQGGYAPDIVPTKAQPFGDVGGLDFEHDSLRSSIEHAYAYDKTATGAQVANDIERLARGGYAEIHLLSGAHGQTNSGIGKATPEQLVLDKQTALQAEARHQGRLKVHVYDANNPKDLLAFAALQRTAVQGNVNPRTATLEGVCYGRNRMSDPNPQASLPPPGSPLSAKEAAVPGGAAVLSGALMIDSGLKDPNSKVGAAKIVTGATQVAGGATYVIGTALRSAAIARVGSVAGELAGHATVPLVAYDVYRHLQQHLQGGDTRTASEKKIEGLTDGLAVGGLAFPAFAVAALGIQYGFMPMAEKAAEIAAPAFVGGMSQAYGIPQQYLWGWSE